jgi:magnesium-transporting ATPase (P-type)
MTVVEAWIGGEHYDEIPSAESFPAPILAHLSEGISVNTTATLLPKEAAGGGASEVLGNKTEGALLLLLRDKFNLDYIPLRAEGFQSGRGDQLMTFTSKRKCMSVIQNLASESRLYTKGAAEVILAKCSKYLNAQGAEVEITANMRRELSASIQTMGKKSLRVLALAHRVTPHKKARNTRSGAAGGGGRSGTPSSEDMESDLTLDALVGIKDPLRPDVQQAVETCQQAGIFVRMVTGDNLETAKAIATECGILSEGGVAMEGPAFRQLTPAQLDEILPTLQVGDRKTSVYHHYYY